MAAADGIEHVVATPHANDRYHYDRPYVAGLLDTLRQRVGRFPQFSLGGNVTLKYLGEGGYHPAVVAGIAISVPIDLMACANAIDHRWSNRIYLRRFLSKLSPKVEAKALRFPGRLDAAGSQRIRTLRDFDNLYTAPIHGFRDAEDYWKKSSARITMFSRPGRPSRKSNV